MVVVLCLVCNSLVAGELIQIVPIGMQKDLVLRMFPNFRYSFTEGEYELYDLGIKITSTYDYKQRLAFKNNVLKSIGYCYFYKSQESRDKDLPSLLEFVSTLIPEQYVSKGNKIKEYENTTWICWDCDDYYYALIIYNEISEDKLWVVTITKYSY